MDVSDTAERFSGGDYTGVLRAPDAGAWQTSAAWALVGRPELAHAGLARFDHPEARFHAGVAHWMEGDEDTALRELRLAGTPGAQRLAALIEKPVIRVLAQLVWLRGGYADLLSGAAADPKFRVENISFAERDLPNRTYADVHRYYDRRRPPDFYVTGMAEWHLLPPNLGELPCPIFGSTTDYDIHVQTVYPWLQLLDEVIVTDTSEWADVRRLVRAPVTTYPKLFVVPSNVGPGDPGGVRDIDVFLSGTILHPYHPDKAKLAQVLLRAADLEVCVVNGHLPDDRYHRLLARTKMSLGYVRHLSALPTRGLEALAAGCVALVPGGCALGLFAGPTEGVVEYAGIEDVASAARRVLAEWPASAAAARRGGEVVRREFSRARVSSQYLRYLTVLAARLRPPRRPPDPAALVQLRTILHRGLLPAPARVLEKATARRVGRGMPARNTLDLARSLTLGYADHLMAGGAPDAGRVATILGAFRASLEAMPSSLVVRLNLLRAAVYFGDAGERAAAVRMAEDTLASDDAWSVDPLDDVFPWDFASDGFDYRAYFDAIVRVLAADPAAAADLRRLVRAALHHYVGRATGSVEHLEVAARLDPGFPYYAFAWARRALDDADPGRRPRALAELGRLVEESALVLPALEVLETCGGLADLDATTREHVVHVGARARQAIAAFDRVGDTPWITSSSAPPLVRKRDWRGTTPQLSLIVADGTDALSAARSREERGDVRDAVEVIWVECHDYVGCAAWALADTVVTCGQSGEPHLHRAWNVGLALARAPVVGFTAAGSGVGRGIAQRYAQVFERSAAAAEIVEEGCLALVRRASAVAAGGHDEDARYRGPQARLADLVERVRAGQGPRPSPPIPRRRSRPLVGLARAVLRRGKNTARDVLPPRCYVRLREMATAVRGRGKRVAPPPAPDVA